MTCVDESYVTLFSALVGELSKSSKQRLVMQLAEILARHATASLEVSRPPTTKEAVEIAARLIHNIPCRGPAPAARPHVASVPPLSKRTRASASVRDDKTVEVAKQAIRLKFESWRAAKPAGHWHIFFARKMIQQHPCIGEQRIVEEWVRGWERQARQSRIHTIDTEHTHRSGTNTAASTSTFWNIRGIR
jgi:hypothetical protein